LFQFSFYFRLASRARQQTKVSCLTHTWLKRLASAKKSSGLYYKHFKMINDASRVVSELCHYFEHYSRVVNYNPRGAIYTHNF